MDTYHLKPSSFASVITGCTHRTGASRLVHMHARPNAVASLQLSKKSAKLLQCTSHSQTGYRLSSLGRAHPIFCSVPSPGGAPQKSGRAHQPFCAPRLSIASSATGSNDVDSRFLELYLTCAISTTNGSCIFFSEMS